ncbi:hypothetical protein WOLCODRAFT_167375 [Wolfiporia cocos MD-104 SS10]|uniref:Uncharacterized protein n=1 Tax=Wolfiporia cocos (strain MD-104) TaxID=742152 RepID=A0A2H3JHJ4_WOLCO|nr:hypothetical protein WOLCODRAFT_167375 [Wolfiporia cocos MD-104 SS10]
MLVFASVLLYIASAAAGLYGTRPVASTVLSAGRFSTVTWINDNSRPSLSEMGPVRIDLYVGGDTLVATLAENVEPTRRHHSVWISPTWGPNGSDYHMRFICEDPPLVIYTADFTITAMDDTPPWQGEAKALAQTASTTSSGSSYASFPAASTLPFSLGSMNFSTAQSVMPTTMSKISTSVASASSSSSTIEPDNPYMNKAKTGASGGLLWKRTAVDLERVKFRLVFILWPALIGMTMAL